MEHHWSALAAKLAAGDGIVGGVLSGTSADGIDVALARFPAPGAGEQGSARAGSRACALRPPELLAFEIAPFDDALARRLRSALDGEPCGLREAALLHRDLGLACGDALAALARSSGWALDLAGSHGQTVWHHDGREPRPATLQLGDGDHVAERAGCAVVCDFRQGDVAAGGEGAPLAPLADDWVFAHLPRPLAVLNLGGMANLTWIDGERTIAFDTGPAGSLLDGLARRLLDLPFDAGGALAARGSALPGLVDEALREPFFDRPPPKSTGRDTFGEPWVGAFHERALRAGASAADTMASAVELVAASVARAAERFLPRPPPELLVAGGGARNLLLVAALARRTGLAVRSTRERGVDPDAREALVFATLAVRAVLGLAVGEQGATGARAPRVLGKLCAAPSDRAAYPPAPPWVGRGRRPPAEAPAPGGPPA